MPKAPEYQPVQIPPFTVSLTAELLYLDTAPKPKGAPTDWKIRVLAMRTFTQAASSFSRDELAHSFGVTTKQFDQMIDQVGENPGLHAVYDHLEAYQRSAEYRGFLGQKVNRIQRQKPEQKKKESTNIPVQTGKEIVVYKKPTVVEFPPAPARRKSTDTVAQSATIWKVNEPRYRVKLQLASHYTTIVSKEYMPLKALGEHYLQKHPGKPFNASAAARQLGKSRTQVAINYKKLRQFFPELPPLWQKGQGKVGLPPEQQTRTRMIDELLAFAADHPGQTVNLSEIARKLGVTQGRISQLYSQEKRKGRLLPPLNPFPRPK